MTVEPDKVFELFNQLRDVRAADRSTQLDQLCGDDLGLRQQVQQLLSRADSDTGWMTGTDIAIPTAPEQLGAYRLLRRIGQGGMGEVYEALHVELDRIVALKTMRMDRAESESFVLRFKRERRLIAQVDSPHVVRVTDAGHDSGVHFLAMERLQGSDLRSVIDSDGPMSSNRAAEVIRQSLVGLAAINDSGLVHRDIKPSNLFLDQDGRIKILDLGIAKPQKLLQSTQSDALTLDDQVVGTPDFLAPEQAQGASDPDIRTDIYALGCVWYFLLTGKPPYNDEQFPNAFLKIMAHVKEPFPSTAELRMPGPLNDLLNQMTTKRREDRPCDPSVLATQIESHNGRVPLVPQQLVDTSPTIGDPTKVSTHTRESTPTVTRRTAILAAIVSGSFALAVVGAGLIWNSTSTSSTRGSLEVNSTESGVLDEETALSELVRRNPGLTRSEFQYTINDSGSPVFESDSRSLKDLSPIASLPIEIIMIDRSSVSNLAPLASLTNLQILQCSSSNKVTSLEPIRSLSLRNIQIHGTQISDLDPVRDMRLTYVDCHNCPIKDLSPLSGMPLRVLDVHGTDVRDLRQLGQMDELEALVCTNTQVEDLTPLLKFPVLKTFYASESVLQKSSFLVDHPNAKNLKCNDKTLASLFPPAR